MELLDELPVDIDYVLKKVKRQKRIFQYCVIFFTIVNGIILSLLHADRDLHSWIGSFLAVLFWEFGVGFYVGSMFAFIPYKGLRYKQKFWRAVFLATMVVSGIMFLLFAVQIPDIK